MKFLLWVLNYTVVLLLLIAAALFFACIRSHTRNEMSIWCFSKVLIVPKEFICVLLVASALVLICFLRFGIGITDNDNSAKPTKIWTRTRITREK